MTLRSYSSEKEQKDHWSDCGQMFFHYGKGYVVADTLQTICLGNEADIKQEEGIGQPAVGAADMERAGNDGAFRRHQKAARLPAIRKRLPLRPPRTKNKNLSGK